MDNIKVIVLDSETTGLKDPEPVEIAYISLRALETYPDKLLITETHKTFQKRFLPTKPIEPGAEKIHGISYNSLKTCDKFSLELLNIPKSVDYIIAHNISYDFRVLRKPENLRKICTVKLAKKLWPELKSHKLPLLIEQFFPEIGKRLTANAHGALVDSKLCLLVLYQAIQEWDLNSWEEIYSIAGQK